MRVTLRVSPFAPLPEVVAFAQRCEDAGFDGIGFLDSQMINRDVFVTMTAAAIATSRIKLITAVTNPVTRHVSVLASAVASIDDLAPGRVEIWLGRGFSAVNLAGLSEATTRELRTAIVQLRGLLAGEWDVFPGTHSQMRIGPRRVQVYLAAQGPLTTRLAGEVADGILIAGSFEPQDWQHARGLIAEGAAKAGRDVAGVGVALSLLTCIRPTREEALRLCGPMIVLRLEDNAWLERVRIDPKGIEPPEAFMALYPDPMHAEDQELAMDLCEIVPYELRSAIADKLGLIGSPADCIERLQALSRAGFDHVFMRTVDTLAFPEAEVEAYGAEIAAAVAQI